MKTAKSVGDVKQKKNWGKFECLWSEELIERIDWEKRI